MTTPNMFTPASTKRSGLAVSGLKHTMVAVLGSLALLATGCGSPTTNNNTNTNSNTNTNQQNSQALTYHKDVRSLIETKCQGCHQPNHIGPFSLTNYQEVVKFKDIIKDSVQSKRMPPWKADNSCNNYKYDFSMSDEQIKTIVTWVDQGTLEGDPSTYQKPQSVEDPIDIRADIKLTLPVKYIPVKKPDDYRCFLVDWPHKETTYVTGFKVLPDNKKIAHHLIAYVAPPNVIATFQKYDDDEAGPGYTCYGGPTGAGGGRNVQALTGIQWIGAWAPGRNVSLMPKDTGIKIPGGSKVIIQMHYNVSAGDPEPDQSAIHFQIESTVKKEGFIVPFADPSWVISQTMAIPAGSVGTQHSYVRELSSKYDLQVHSAGLHLHTRGKTGVINVETQDEKNKGCALRINQWDFNWQGSYALQNPIRVNKGEKIRLSCTWDNSAANQPMIDGKKAKPQDLNWGDGTYDEMCLGILFVSVAD